MLWVYGKYVFLLSHSITASWVMSVGTWMTDCLSLQSLTSSTQPSPLHCLFSWLLLRLSASQNSSHKEKSKTEKAFLPSSQSAPESFLPLFLLLPPLVFNHSLASIRTSMQNHCDKSHYCPRVTHDWLPSRTALQLSTFQNSVLQNYIASHIS